MRYLRTAFMMVLLGMCAASFLVQMLREQKRQMVRPAELYDVIWRQVAAFRSQDYRAAYQQASGSFQERFDMNAFTDLVFSDLPPLRLADRVEFGAVRWEDQEAFVPAYFFMPDREVIPCVYTLVQEDGQWKIEGVVLQKRWRAGRRLGGLRT